MEQKSARLHLESSGDDTETPSTPRAKKKKVPEGIREKVKQHQDLYDKEWEFEMRQHQENKKDYGNEELAVYSILWTQFMSPVMQRRLEQEPDYSAKVHNKPVECLKRVKAQINENTYSVHPMISMIGSVQRFFDFQQQPDQAVQEMLEAV